MYVHPVYLPRVVLCKNILRTRQIAQYSCKFIKFSKCIAFFFNDSSVCIKKFDSFQILSSYTTQAAHDKIIKKWRNTFHISIKKPQIISGHLLNQPLLESGQYQRSIFILYVHLNPSLSLLSANLSATKSEISINKHGSYISVDKGLLKS